MLYRIAGLLLLLTVSCFTNAQISPKPGAKLTYNQIMFEYEKVYGADEYVVQVGINENGDFRDGRILAEQKDSSTATMLGGFKFGKNIFGIMLVCTTAKGWIGKALIISI